MKPTAKKLRDETISRLLDKRGEERILKIASELPPQTWDNVIKILEDKT